MTIVVRAVMTERTITAIAHDGVDARAEVD